MLRLYCILLLKKFFLSPFINKQTPKIIMWGIVKVKFRPFIFCVE